MQLQTINDMRMILADDIQRLREGKSTAANVNATVNAAGKILSTIKMEMEYNKLLGQTPSIAFMSTPSR